MTLEEVNQELLELEPKYNKAGEEYSLAYQECETEKARLYLNEANTYSNQTARDAFVVQVMNENSMTDNLIRKRTNFKRLEFRFNLLSEIASNLRAMQLSVSKK